MSKGLRKILRIILWTVAGIILLVILAATSLTVPAVQNLVKNKVITYLKKKTDTEISLEQIRITFPSGLKLQQFYIADKNHDTLLYAGNLSVQLNMLGFLRNKVEVNSIALERVYANVHRLHPDTVFNYQFLVDSLVSDAQEEVKPPKEDTAPLQLKLGKILLDDIRINFKDDVAGNDAGIALTRLNAVVDKCDLENMHYVLDRLDLKDTRLHYFQNKPLTTLKQVAVEAIETTQDESGGSLPLIEVKSFSFNGVELKYDDRLSDMQASAFLKTFHLRDLLIDLTHGKYQTDKGELSNSIIEFAYHPGPSTNEDKKTTTDTTEASSFSLNLNNIVLANNRIKYDDLSAPREQGGVMDFNHLNVKGLSLNAEKFIIDSSGITAVIKDAQLKDTCGFELNDLKGRVVYNTEKLSVEDLIIKTPHTSIHNNTLLTYSSIDDLTKYPERVGVALSFDNSTLGLADAAYFSTAISATYRHQQLQMVASVKGRLNDITIHTFRLHGLKNTDIDITGNIRGLPDTDKAYFNINIPKLRTSKADINALAPKGTIPQDIELPGYIAASGKFAGSIKNFTTHFNINTDMGNAQLHAKMGGSAKTPSYTAHVDLSKVHVGKLLKRNDVGELSLVLDLNGSGITPETANAVVNGKILSAQYNNYNYQNIQLDGKFANQTLELATSSPDSNAHFDIVARASIGGQYPSLTGNIDLKRIDLQKLNFSDTELKIAGLAVLDFPTLDPDYLNGTAVISSVQIATDGKVLNMDTVQLAAQATDSSNYLRLTSEIISAELNGKYQLTQIGQAFINEISKYYAFAPAKPTPPQHMQFHATVHDSKLLKELVPELKAFNTSTLNGVLNTDANNLTIHGNFPRIAYGDFNINNIQLNIGNRDTTALDYELNIANIQSPSIQLYNAAVTGNAADNLLHVSLFLRDSKNRDKYTIGGNFKAADGTYQFSLDPQQLLLNYDRWNVAADNLIQYGNAGIYIRNFVISNNGQALSANSISDTPNAPIKIAFKDFMLETLTRYAEQDTSLVGGLLNGTVELRNVTDSMQLEANLAVSQLRYQKDLLGDLEIYADNYTKDAYKADITLSGPHDLRISGFYYTSDKGALDITAAINRIDLKYIESLSGGQVRNGSGTLTGNITAKGSLTSPKVLGNLQFKEAGLNITQLNSYIRLKNETISFVDDGIQFNNLTILDSSNQALTLNGMIKTKDYQNFGFDLRLRANNFRVLNSTVADNELFYGKVYLTAMAQIGGDMNKPEVTGTLRVNKDTRFFFAIPDSDPDIVNQEGIVEFVDMDAPPNNGRQALDVDSITRAPLKGINLSMNLLTEKEAEITIVVDPANGDALLVKGEAELNLTMDPSGTIAMTGRYLISEGNYNLSIGGLARRKFILQQGSYIQWTGAPTEANINITATYNINTSAIDLIADQIQNVDQSTKTTYKQKLPFIVYLKMTDQLLKPRISFQIDMPENERNAFSGIVYTRLQQLNTNESELNKQVFALLALNRFVSENPFESLSSGISPEMLARQSVSRLLTQQLNNLAADLIKDVDISFDLTSEEDYSTGSQQTRTDLNVALSKKLLNDRLTITVGSDFALEGSRNTGSGTNIAGNVNIEYALSRDGRYRLRAYRRNQNEGVIEGQIIETGLGFALVVDYNRFKEIFDSFKKRNRRGRER